MHGEVCVNVHVCLNDYSNCTKCEVHDHVCKHVIRYTKKNVPRFLIFEALKDDDNDQIVPSMLCTIEEIELVQ